MAYTFFFFKKVHPAFVLNLLDKQQYTVLKTANGGTSLPYNKTYRGERIIQAVVKGEALYTNTT